ITLAPCRQSASANRLRQLSFPIRPSSGTRQHRVPLPNSRLTPPQVLKAPEVLFGRSLQTLEVGRSRLHPELRSKDVECTHQARGVDEPHRSWKSKLFLPEERGGDGWHRIQSNRLGVRLIGVHETLP